MGTEDQSTEDTSEESSEETTKETTKESSEKTTSEESIATESAKSSDADGDEEDGEEGDGKGDDKGDQDDGAPEKYADFNLPDELVFDGERLETAGELFKGLDLSQEAAQTIVDYFVADQAKLAEATEAQQQVEAQAKLDEIHADPALGGQNLKESQTLTGRAIYGFDVDDGMREYLNTPVNGQKPGNDLRVVRFLAAVGNAMAEDSGGDRGNGAEKGNFLGEMYPTMDAD